MNEENIKKIDKRVVFSAEEVDGMLFDLYMLESNMSNWNNDKRERRVANRAEAYNMLSRVIATLQNKS